METRLTKEEDTISRFVVVVKVAIVNMVGVNHQVSHCSDTMIELKKIEKCFEREKKIKKMLRMHPLIFHFFYIYLYLRAYNQILFVVTAFGVYGSTLIFNWRASALHVQLRDDSRIILNTNQQHAKIDER